MTNCNSGGTQLVAGSSERICQQCGRTFIRKGTRGECWNRFCSKTCKKESCMGQPFQALVTKSCGVCGKSFSFPTSGEANNLKRRFCSNPCAAHYRNHQPGRQAAFDSWIRDARGTGSVKLKGRPNAKNSEHMKRIWSDPEYRSRVLPNYQGKTFLSRGGNSRLTVPQQQLAEVLGLPMEFAILTRPVWNLFESLPNCYKVDLADPSCRLAIEVDGHSHRSRLWRFLDHRKTEVLAALGWKVIRFKNEEVLADLPTVVDIINSTRQSLIES